MFRPKSNQKVIVHTTNGNKVGIITGKSIKNKKTVYNILLESGVELYYIPVGDGDGMHPTYINESLTKRAIPQITTNLDVATKGNVLNENN